MCSRCGILFEKDLSERVHNCSQCGLSLDRDWNAAINILGLVLQSVGIKTAEARHLKGAGAVTFSHQLCSSLFFSFVFLHDIFQSAARRVPDGRRMSQAEEELGMALADGGFQLASQLRNADGLAEE